MCLPGRLPIRSQKDLFLFTPAGKVVNHVPRVSRPAARLSLPGGFPLLIMSASKRSASHIADLSEEGSAAAPNTYKYVFMALWSARTGAGCPSVRLFPGRVIKFRSFAMAKAASSHITIQLTPIHNFFTVVQNVSSVFCYVLNPLPLSKTIEKQFEKETSNKILNLTTKISTKNIVYWKNCLVYVAWMKEKKNKHKFTWNFSVFPRHF